MFGLSKKSADFPEQADQPKKKKRTLPKGYTPAKGAPTPRRKDQEAKNRRPIVSDQRKLTKEEKKARKAEARARSNELYQKQQEAMRTGDEANMPYQHQGPIRRFGRDYIDASSPLAGWFMPIAFLMLPLIFLQQYAPRAMSYVVLGIYGLFFVMLIQAIFIVRRAKLLATHKFGKEKMPSGFFAQLLGRSFYLRRWRLPSPQVKRGEFPNGGSKADLKAARAAKKATE